MKSLINKSLSCDHFVAVFQNVLELRVLKFEMRFLYVILILALGALTGCVTRSQANAQARAAYAAGERAAYQTLAAHMTDIIVLGDVQKHDLPWVAGLTLAQALATANYVGLQNPQEIIVKRNSVEIPVDPRQLMRGQSDMLLQPGDTVSVVGK